MPTAPYLTLDAHDRRLMEAQEALARGDREQAARLLDSGDDEYGSPFPAIFLAIPCALVMWAAIIAALALALAAAGVR